VKDSLKQLQDLVENGATIDALRHAHRRCFRQVAFDDFCQSVLLHAIEHLESFRGATTPELIGWLQAIGRQLAMKMRRAAIGGIHTGLPDVPDHFRSSEAEQAAHELEHDSDMSWLSGILTHLPWHEYTLLRRHYWGHQSMVAIARDLEVSADVVRQRHCRLIQRLHSLNQSRDSEIK
jgi:RNA polymerase sigma factor (sigma-70 family)